MSGADPLGQVKSGDPLPTSAKTWNALLSAARRTRQPSKQTSRVSVSHQNPVFVQVKNDAGRVVDRFGIMRLDNILVSPTANLNYYKNSEPCFVGKVPTDECQIVVMLERTAHNSSAPRIGKGIISGYVNVLVDVQSANHQWAIPIDGMTSALVSAEYGYPILAKESGTGVKWCVVFLGPQTCGSRIVKAPSGGIPPRVNTVMGSATCEIYEKNALGSLITTGRTIQVFNWYSRVFADKGDRFAKVEWYDEAWWAEVDDCLDSGSTSGGGGGTGGGGNITVPGDSFGETITSPWAMGRGGSVSWTNPGSGYVPDP